MFRLEQPDLTITEARFVGVTLFIGYDLIGTNLTTLVGTNEWAQTNALKLESLTPWTTDINGAGFTLTNFHAVLNSAVFNSEGSADFFSGSGAIFNSGSSARRSSARCSSLWPLGGTGVSCCTSSSPSSM
jgi:hypothetical protein